MMATEASTLSTETKFEINARSCTLLGPEGLLDSKQYQIPVYQRPYSWDSEQVNRLFKGIIQAYRNEQEPYFLGTVQLMPKEAFQEIVDGQQRLTTLLLLFKLAHLKEPALKHLAPLNWLRTVVNKEKQQQMLDEVLSAVSLENIERLNLNLNKYAANLLAINEFFEEAGGPDAPFLIDSSLIDYISTQLYFVIIETKAGLAKTLDIFNTINTAGMDLNGGDVFKVQLFDYLTKQKGQPDEAFEEKVFDEIDSLYSEIDTNNKTAGRKVCDIQSILGIYKHMLIEGAQASRELHDLGTATFFERLFATLLWNEKQKHFDEDKFGKALKHELAPLETLRKLIEARFLWDDKNFNPNRDRIWTNLVWRSRYGRHWILDFIYLFKFNGKKASCFKEFRELRAKFYFIQSVRFQKAVNESHTFTYDLTRKILSEGSREEDIIIILKEKISQIGERDVNFKKNHLMQDIFHISRKRDLICWLLSILEEKDLSDEQLYERFFKKGVYYDVEHIHPRKPETQTPEEKEEWTPVLNTVGNLILLERKINRSVSNRKFDDKASKDKRLGYKDSQLKQVKTFLLENPVGCWTVQKCQARTEREADKVMEFLFSK